jgi:hypothetical protein
MAKLHSFQVRTSTGALIILIVAVIVTITLFDNLESFNEFIEQFNFKNISVEKLLN